MTPIEDALNNAMRELGLEPKSQYKVDIFTCDFGFPDYKVIVECDGHEFHSTKEQRSADAKRDRKLQRCGWRVLRYTGSQIYSDVTLCALEIKDYLESVEKAKHQAAREAFEKAKHKVSKEAVERLDRAGYDTEIWLMDDGAAIKASKPSQTKEEIEFGSEEYRLRFDEYYASSRRAD